MIVQLTCLALLLVVYFAWVRPYLKTLPSFSEIYADEASAWATIKTWVRGRRTVLIGVWGELAAQAPDVLDQLKVVDLKTLLHLSEQWALYVTALIPVFMIIFRTKADKS